MKKLMLFLLLTISAMAQDIQHAPTIDQCRADTRLWLSQSSTQKDAFNDLTPAQIGARIHEMFDCVPVDSHNSAAYENLRTRFAEAMMFRYASFILRRGLQQQFLDEDAKGAR